MQFVDTKKILKFHFILTLYILFTYYDNEHFKTLYTVRICAQEKQKQKSFECVGSCCFLITNLINF